MYVYIHTGVFINENVFMLKEMMGDKFFKLNSILNTGFILFFKKNKIKIFCCIIFKF